MHLILPWAHKSLIARRANEPRIFILSDTIAGVIKLVVGHFLEDLVVGGFVEETHVLQLVSDLSLGPLLFGLLSASGSRFGLCLFRLLRCLGHFCRLDLLDNRNRTQKWDESPC